MEIEFINRKTPIKSKHYNPDGYYTVEKTYLYLQKYYWERDLEKSETLKLGLLGDYRQQYEEAGQDIVKALNVFINNTPQKYAYSHNPVDFRARHDIDILSFEYEPEIYATQFMPYWKRPKLEYPIWDHAIAHPIWDNNTGEINIPITNELEEIWILTPKSDGLPGPIRHNNFMLTYEEKYDLQYDSYYTHKPYRKLKSETTSLIVNDETYIMPGDHRRKFEGIYPDKENTIELAESINHELLDYERFIITIMKDY